MPIKPSLIRNLQIRSLRFGRRKRAVLARDLKDVQPPALPVPQPCPGRAACYRPLQRPPCKNGDHRRAPGSGLCPVLLALPLPPDFFELRELFWGHRDERCPFRRCARIGLLHLGHVVITGLASPRSRSVWGASLASISLRFDAKACNDFRSVVREGRSTIAWSSLRICSDVFSASGKEDREGLSP